MFVISGGNTIIYPDVWSSGDGMTWTQVTGSAAFGARWNHTSIAYNNGIWVIAGQNISNGSLGDVWWSQ